METVHLESRYPADVRFHEIEKILSYVKSGNSCQVVGAQGVGRANILGFLAYNKPVRLKHLGDEQQSYHFVMVNFSEVQHRPLIDVMKFLFLAIGDSLRDRGMHEEYAAVRQHLKEALEIPDELVLMQGLKHAIDFLAVEKGFKLVLLFERFEDYVPAVTNDFFTQLYSIRNRAKLHFSIIFSLNRPLEQSVDPSAFADMYRLIASHIVYLPIHDTISVDFRLSVLEEAVGKQLPESVKQDILNLTGGHGKMTKVCAEEYLHQDEVPDDLLAFFLSNKPVRNVSYEIWEALQPSEQKLLKKLVSHDAVDDREANQLAHTYLENIGLLFDGKCTIPLFERFILYRVEHQLDDKFVMNEATGEILKGDLLLSDKLTKGEYRLLKHLLTHTDRVVEREELIQSVWPESKSTAGISDQAIDQLIFRLRRKVETDPNNPTHIRTIKGRGLQFTP
jgi:hypothetical protein